MAAVAVNGETRREEVAVEELAMVNTAKEKTPTEGKKRKILKTKNTLTASVLSPYIYGQFISRLG